MPDAAGALGNHFNQRLQKVRAMKITLTNSALENPTFSSISVNQANVLRGYIHPSD